MEPPARLVENPAGLFFQHAASTPGALALAVDGEELSYGALALRAGGVAQEVRALAEILGRPPRIAILARRSVEVYAGILGSLAGGGTHLPIDVRLPAARLDAIASAASVDAVVVDARTRTPHSFRAVKPLDARLDARLDGRLEPPQKLPRDHPCYLLFTSGSTGVPKGVIVSAGALAAFQASIRALYRFAPRERFGQFIETTFDISLFELFGAWDAGASLHVVPEAALAAPDRFIRERALTVWTAAPSLIPALERAGRLTAGSLPSLRTAFFCGEALEARHAALWRDAAPACAIDNHYGPTESTVACSRYRVPATHASVRPGRDTLSIGAPYPDTLFGVIAPDGRFLGDEEPGELVISGPQLASGYLGSLGSDRFVDLTHPAAGTSRWYRTGDAALRDPAGQYHFLGRLDLQAKLQGHRVELEEVEAALREAGISAFAAAVAWPREGALALGLVAFIDGEPPPDWRATLAAKLPAWGIPSRLIALAQRPLTSHGKLDRRALEALLAAEASEPAPRTLPLAAEAPEPAPPTLPLAAATTTEARIARLWSELLGLAHVPLDRSFNELGGDSARLIRLVAAIWDQFGDDLSADELLRDDSVSGIAAALERSAEKAS